MKRKVYLGVGSNLGNRRLNIKKALEMLGLHKEIEILAVSSLHETMPEGGPAQGKYLNGAVAIRTKLSPRELLNEINKIESSLGRVRLERNGPRTIDIDILIYEGCKICDSDLIIPHPRMNEREFVLKPLAEIAKVKVKVKAKVKVLL